MTDHTRGIITIATVSVAFSAMALTAWMGWVSKETIDNKVNTAAVVQWQNVYGSRIDWLVQRSGANPEAIK